MLDTVTSLDAQAGSRLNVTDDRSPGTSQEFTCTATLTAVQQDAVRELARHDLGVLVAPLGSGKTVMACSVFSTSLTCGNARWRWYSSCVPSWEAPAAAWQAAYHHGPKAP